MDVPAEQQPEVVIVGCVRGWKNICGFIGWLMRGLIHTMYLLGFRTKPAVMLDWYLSYMISEKGSCIITGDPETKISEIQSLKMYDWVEGIDSES